jgi:ankyrin repeat protein
LPVNFFSESQYFLTSQDCAALLASGGRAVRIVIRWITAKLETRVMSASQPLSLDASLQDYELQARSLYQSLQAGAASARWRFKWEHPRFRGKPVTEVESDSLTLDDAQLVIAQENSFKTWPDLLAFLEAIRSVGPVRQFESAVNAVVTGDLPALQALLQANPQLVHARSTRRHHATLLHYLGANGVEGGRQKTPAHALAIAKTLLDAGAAVDALADLYDNPCTTMSMLVSSCHPHAAGLQIPLAELLLDYGAALGGAGTAWQSPLLTALIFGYPDTAAALARRGAPIHTLPEAAGLGLAEETTRLLPDADSLQRHQALALAAQLGHAEIVRLLLDAGEDPNRFNPERYHAHATPLHHAAGAGHLAVVQLLIQRGARRDLRDKLNSATPRAWAEHGNHGALVEFLRAGDTSNA